MPRPRKPTNLLMLSGALDHDRKRYADRTGEPADDRALGPPPETLEAPIRAAWLEIERLAPWLVFADRLAVELAARLLVFVRLAGAGGASPAHLSRLQAALGALGLTPADRSKVKMPARKPSNRFERFGKRTGETA
jgi:hypothetical protein